MFSMKKDILIVGYAVTDIIKGKEYYGGGAATRSAINGHTLGFETGLLSLFGTDPRSQFILHLSTRYWLYS